MGRRLEFPHRRSFTANPTYRRRLHRRWGGVCFWCGRALASPDGCDMHADHAEPLSVGGLDRPANIVPSCPSCNQSKSDKEVGHVWMPPRGTDFRGLVARLSYRSNMLGRDFEFSAYQQQEDDRRRMQFWAYSGLDH